MAYSKLVELEQRTLDLDFDKDTHTYIYKGQVLKPITTLLKELGVSPDYSSVDEETLTKARNRGIYIHKSIETWIKTGIDDSSYELAQFIDWLDENNLKVIGSEVIVHNDVLAGTIDLILEDKATGQLIIADIKTTSTIHIESVSWQNSFYAYLDKVFHPIYDESLCLHFDKEGELNIKKLNWKSTEHIVAIINDLINGKKLKLPSIVIDDNSLMVIEDCLKQIKYYETLKKDFDDKINEMKEKLINAFEENNVKSFDNDRIRIVYVAPKTQTRLDSVALKKDHPELVENYTKINTTKASILITLKDEKQD